MYYGNPRARIRPIADIFTRIEYPPRIMAEVFDTDVDRDLESLPTDLPETLNIADRVTGYQPIQCEYCEGSGVVVNSDGFARLKSHPIFRRLAAVPNPPGSRKLTRLCSDFRREMAAFLDRHNCCIVVERGAEPNEFVTAIMELFPLVFFDSTAVELVPFYAMAMRIFLLEKKSLVLRFIGEYEDFHKNTAKAKTDLVRFFAPTGPFFHLIQQPEFAQAATFNYMMMRATQRVELPLEEAFQIQAYESILKIIQKREITKFSYRVFCQYANPEQNILDPELVSDALRRDKSHYTCAEYASLQNMKQMSFVVKKALRPRKDTASGNGILEPTNSTGQRRAQNVEIADRNPPSGPSSHSKSTQNSANADSLALDRREARARRFAATKENRSRVKGSALDSQIVPANGGESARRPLNSDASRGKPMAANAPRPLNSVVVADPNASVPNLQYNSPLRQANLAQKRNAQPMPALTGNPTAKAANQSVPRPPMNAGNSAATALPHASSRAVVPISGRVPLSQTAPETVRPTVAENPAHRSAISDPRRPPLPSPPNTGADATLRIAASMPQSEQSPVAVPNSIRIAVQPTIPQPAQSSTSPDAGRSVPMAAKSLPNLPIVSNIKQAAEWLLKMEPEVRMLLMETALKVKNGEPVDIVPANEGTRQFLGILVDMISNGANINAAFGRLEPSGNRNERKGRSSGSSDSQQSAQPSDPIPRRRLEPVAAENPPEALTEPNLESQASNESPANARSRSNSNVKSEPSEDTEKSIGSVESNEGHYCKAEPSDESDCSDNGNSPKDEANEGSDSYSVQPNDSIGIDANENDENDENDWNIGNQVDDTDLSQPEPDDGSNMEENAEEVETTVPDPANTSDCNNLTPKSENSYELIISDEEEAQFEGDPDGNADNAMESQAENRTSQTQNPRVSLLDPEMEEPNEEEENLPNPNQEEEEENEEEPTDESASERSRSPDSPSTPTNEDDGTYSPTESDSELPKGKSTQKIQKRHYRLRSNGPEDSGNNSRSSNQSSDDETLDDMAGFIVGRDQDNDRTYRPPLKRRKVSGSVRTRSQSIQKREQSAEKRTRSSSVQKKRRKSKESDSESTHNQVVQKKTQKPKQKPKGPIARSLDAPPREQRKRLTQITQSGRVQKKRTQKTKSVRRNPQIPKNPQSAPNDEIKIANPQSVPNDGAKASIQPTIANLGDLSRVAARLGARGFEETQFQRLSVEIPKKSQNSAEMSPKSSATTQTPTPVMSGNPSEVWNLPAECFHIPIPPPEEQCNQEMLLEIAGKTDCVYYDYQRLHQRLDPKVESSFISRIEKSEKTQLIIVRISKKRWERRDTIGFGVSLGSVWSPRTDLPQESARCAYMVFYASPKATEEERAKLWGRISPLKRDLLFFNELIDLTTKLNFDCLCATEGSERKLAKMIGRDRIIVP